MSKTNHSKNENKINKSNKKIINNKKIEKLKKYIYNNSRKFEKYKDISKTMPNLKKTFDSNRVYNKIDILDNERLSSIIPVLTTININYNNNKILKIKTIKSNKNFCYNNKNLKCIKLVKHNFRNICGNIKNDIDNRCLKYLIFEDKTKLLNKTNDKLNIPIKEYNQFFNKDKMKLETKKFKINEEKYHKLFKSYYSQLNHYKSNDYLIKKLENNIINNNYTMINIKQKEIIK